MVMVTNLPLCGLMPVMLGVMRGAVMMDVPVKFCASLPVLVRCASAPFHTVYPTMSCLSGSLMCVSVRIEDQDVDSVHLHDRDDAVYLSRLHESCGVTGDNA